MVTAKYYSWNAILNRYKEVIATVISTGVAQAGAIVALDGTGHLDVSLMPVGVGPTVVVLPTSEVIAAGSYVNVYDSGAGVMKVRNAIATAYATRAMGFLLAGAASGANATVYSNEINIAQAGLTPGEYFLSDVTPGAVTLTPPTTATHIIQHIGNYVSATELMSNIEEAPLELS